MACTSKQQQVCGYAFLHESTGKWGIVSTEGELLTTDIFAYQPTSVVNGMFSVPDKQGNYKLYNIYSPLLPISSQSFHRIGHFFDEVTWAQETPYSPFLLIDKQGRVIVSTAQYPQYNIRLVYNYSDGLSLIVTDEGKYGYMDTQGNIIIPPIYDRATNFNEDIALVGMSNATGEIGFQIINKKGRVIAPIRLDKCIIGNTIKDGMIAYKNIETGLCGLINHQGLPIINLPEEVYFVHSINDGKIVFQSNRGYGIIHPNGEILLDADYENIHDLTNGRWGLASNNLWALADENGKHITDYSYQYIGAFHTNCYAIAKQDSCYFLIDKEGKQATTESYTKLVDEKTAFYNVPQYFIQQDSIDEKKTENTHQSQYVKHTNNQVENKISHIRKDGWKEIAKESPFFNEVKKVLAGNLEENDAKNRKDILNYVEHLRTSYTTKDIDFLEQLFSENALIIVGTVVKMEPSRENNYLPPEQIIYNVKSKREYLSKLKLIFKTNQTIELNFSDFHIKRHPTKEGIYGVVLRQGYKSDHYSDDGYLFLLWDFRNKTAPKIHVRTWQPYITPENTPINKDEVFDIRNFNLQ